MRSVSAQIDTQDTALAFLTLLLSEQATALHILGHFSIQNLSAGHKNINRNFVSRKLSQAEGGKGAESIACLAKQSLWELIEL